MCSSDLVHYVLTGHGIDDHKDLVGIHGLLDVLRLGHHSLVDVQTARRVDDDHIAQVVWRSERRRAR